MCDSAESTEQKMDTVPHEATVPPLEDEEMPAAVDQPTDPATVPSTSEVASSETTVAATEPTVPPPPVDNTVLPTASIDPTAPCQPTEIEGEATATVPPPPVDSTILPTEEAATVPPPTVAEVRQERRERRVLSGMAAMLAMMRDGGGEQEEDEQMEEEEAADESVTPAAAPTEPVAVQAATAAAAATSPDVAAQPPAAAAAAAAAKKPEPLGEGGSRKLNRQERRAMMRAQGMFEENAAKKVDEKREEEQAPPPPPVGERRKVRMEMASVSSSPVFSETAVFSNLPTPAGYQPVVYGNNYVRSVQFSSGGRNLATTSQDRLLRLFKFDEDKGETSLTVSLPLGGLIYDAAWHPKEEWMATSSRDHPIHVWNDEGERMMSFRGINHLDELSSANTLRFAVDGSRLYAGYHKYLRIFDLTRPGRQTREIKTWSREHGGQRALLSCIAMHPVYAGVMAVGCYGRSIGLYSDNCKAVECLFEIDHSALTQLEYSADGVRLYGATRNDSAIVCYDLRNPGQTLFTLDRPGHTNQSFAFDLDGSDRFLISGSSTGEVLVFDVKTGERAPVQRVKATESALVGVSLHPSAPLLATCSGERIYRVMELSDDDDEDEGEAEKRLKRDQGEGGETRQPEKYSEGKQQLHNGFQIWRL